MKKFIKFLKIAFLPCATIFVGSIFTGAYFTDSIKVSNNSLTTGSWSATATSTATGTSTPLPSGNVVLNELMWMGSVGGVQDEWIELRNTTNSTIDLSNWQITGMDGSMTEGLLVTIPAGKTISANGIFLISRKAKDISAINVDPDLVDNDAFLSNSTLKIRLYSGDWTNSANIVDTAGGGGSPLAGLNGTSKQSMSRNSTPGDGTQATSWYTDTTSNSTTYWDSADGNYGTPGGPNV